LRTIQDYIEIRPEKEEAIKRLVSERRLLIGPWFCLPDEFCVGGESLIRNLLLGHKIARRFGHVSKTGYSPFSWGQISQMPCRLLQGHQYPGRTEVGDFLARRGRDKDRGIAIGVSAQVQRLVRLAAARLLEHA